MSCSFCGKGENAVEQLICGPNGIYICNECIEACNALLDEQAEAEEEEVSKDFSVQLLKPHEIKAKLDEYIVGQDEAKKVLSVAVYITTSASTRVRTATTWNWKRATC